MDSLKKYASSALAYVIIFVIVLIIVRVLASLLMFTVSLVAVAIIAFFIWGGYVYFTKGKKGTGDDDHQLLGD